jgi:hypothetical protein
MAIQIQGNGGTIAEVETSRAQRSTLRGTDPTTLGSYRLSMQTGVMAAGLAASSEIFQFRWTDASRLCVINKVNFEGCGSIVAFAAGVAQFRLAVARSWTVDGSGGTAATITANNQKLRASFGTTLLGAARMASTAALTAGTKTLDAQDIGSTLGSFPATAGAAINPDSLFQPIPGVEYPIVLAQNEGLVVRATVPATGTWTAGLTVVWTEVASY